MQTVTLEVEEGFLPTLRSLLEQYPKNKVVIKDDLMRLEIEQRATDIQCGDITTIPYSDVMDRVFKKWEEKCK